MLEFMGEAVLFGFIAYIAASAVYYFWVDRPNTDSFGGTKAYDEKLSNCPKCGERMERGFSPKNSGLGWIPAKQMKGFMVSGEHLVNVGLRRLLISRAEYALSYHCSNCQLYTIDYGTSCSRQEANQLASSITATE